MNNLPEQWHERLETEGADTRVFLLMGQTLGQLMDLADTGLAPAGAQIVLKQAASIDWGKLYHDSPHVLTQVARSCDQRTGLFTDEAMQTKELTGVLDCVLSQLGSLLVELKVATDHVLALMTWGTTMRELLTLAEASDDAALCKVLSVNPLLAYHDGIARRIQQATATQEHNFLRKMQRALEHRPRRHKNAKPGFIMAVLWDAGLKYLLYSQIHDYLQVVGLQGIPSPQALERYGQRLGLKTYHIDPPRIGHEGT